MSDFVGGTMEDAELLLGMTALESMDIEVRPERFRDTQPLTQRCV